MWIRTCAAALAVAWCPLASAATGPRAGTWTLEDALARAEAESPLVRRARAEVALARAGRVGAGIVLPSNPVITGEVGGRRDQSASAPPADGVEAAVRLEQAVEIGGQRGTRLREADARIAAAQARVHLATVETRARVRLLYIYAQLARERVAAAQREEELGTRLYTSATARAQAGAASDIDVRLAQIERGRLSAERVQAELALADARAELKRWLRLPPGDAITVADVMARPGGETRPTSVLSELARRQRAELATLAADRNQLDATLVRLARERVPTPTFFIGWAHQQPGQDYLGGGLALPLPLFRRNQGELARARAEADRLELERALTGEAIELEVDAAVRALHARTAEADLWDREVVPAAEGALSLVDEGWRAGKLDLFRLIQAARDAAAARRARLERLGLEWEAAVALDRALGTP